MPTDQEIATAANMVIKKHGDGAMIHSLLQLAQMVDADDVEGGIVWGRIQKAIIDLQDIKPRR